ncbi:glycerate 3-kinase [Spirosoma luteolum]
MHLLLAPDKFRGSLTATQAAQAMADGVAMARPDATVQLLPLADGGEGTAPVLTRATGGSWHTTRVDDPLGRPVEAGFGRSGDGRTAFVEMAEASGLARLQPAERNPLLTSTLGTGQLIREAVAPGVTQLVLGIGGSATTDAGIGMAAALGWQFLDAAGTPLAPVGGALTQVARLVPPTEPVFPAVRVSVACDVQNPLAGPEGAAHVYGPQKGATPAMVAELDAGLRNLARVVQQQFGVDLDAGPGAGAAGGLGAGCRFFLHAQLLPGVDLVLDAVQFDAHCRRADYVLTGEGKLDGQTLQGKLLHGITQRAGPVPVLALCGTLALDPDGIRALGLRAAFSVLTRPQRLAEAQQTAYDDLRQATFNVCRLF